jgi:hypothetical protein
MLTVGACSSLCSRNALISHIGPKALELGSWLLITSGTTDYTGAQCSTWRLSKYVDDLTWNIVLRTEIVTHLLNVMSVGPHTGKGFPSCLTTCTKIITKMEWGYIVVKYGVLREPRISVKKCFTLFPPSLPHFCAHCVSLSSCYMRSSRVHLSVFCVS